jgi:hypothetical protein
MARVQTHWLDRNDGFGWFLYVAICPIRRGDAVVKIGISELPFSRLQQINCGSPFPVRIAFFGAVGTKKAALRAERALLVRFKQYKTRGEWFWLKTERGNRQDLGVAFQRAIFDSIGRLLPWEKVTGRMISTAIRSGVALQRR